MHDIFVLLKSENHINNLLLYLNSSHSNIGFTCEIEKDRSLAFLDINVYRRNNKLETSVHCKSNLMEFIPTKDPLLQLGIKVV